MAASANGRENRCRGGGREGDRPSVMNVAVFRGLRIR